MSRHAFIKTSWNSRGFVVLIHLNEWLRFYIFQWPKGAINFVKFEKNLESTPLSPELPE